MAGIDHPKGRSKIPTHRYTVHPIGRLPITNEITSRPGLSSEGSIAWTHIFILCSICNFCKKYFSPSSLVICFFYNPTHQIETNIANRWETSNSKSPRLIIMIDQSETGDQKSDYIYYIGAQLCCAVTILKKMCNYAGPKPFCGDKQACFVFPSSN